nr:hypothetical protein [Chloroflexota bacterium]
LLGTMARPPVPGAAMIREERDPFREPTDDELATLDMPDDLRDDDELATLDRLDALDPALDGDEIAALLLDADADAKEDRD